MQVCIDQTGSDICSLDVDQSDGRGVVLLVKPLHSEDVFDFPFIVDCQCAVVYFRDS